MRSAVEGALHWGRIGLNLVLVSTPFQTLIAASVLQTDGVGTFDLVYSARADVPAHRRHFEKLAARARHAVYAADVRAPTSMLRHALRRLRLRRFYESEYDAMYLANIDSLLFRDLAGHHPHTRVFTFDDGAANVFMSSRLHRGATPGERQAAMWLRVTTIDQLRDRIESHATVYAGLDNIVEPARIRHVRLFNVANARPQQGEITFFLGQPYEDAIAANTLDANGVEMLRAWLRNNPVDYYLAHPREIAPIVPEVRVQRSQGLAEEQIFTLAGDARPKLFGWFTSVLLNVPAEQADKTYLSVNNGPTEEERVSLMQRAGCSVHHV